ncbi:PHD finger protein 1 isoform C [Alligator mississippiensis]|uniref:PHD finger protein 1 isoform C n=1 Tax=Alligator mississippiensis TaxID=8496 RepID=A0A151NVX6_ALLMI|nr:PHD finger protein 1 isoform C [Alligator mississippiensis]
MLLGRHQDLVGHNVMASELPTQSSRVTRTTSRLASGPWKRPAGAPTAPVPAPSRPRFWEGQDVLARWTDGLLYLGTIKKVDSSRQVCLVQFEDNSQFLVLWKDINPAAVPGEEQTCCVCYTEAVSAENQLVRCEKCGHAYHQECHLPTVLEVGGNGAGVPGTWTCRQCVFAVATKRGGALKKGPYAKAMLSMKMVLPYELKALEWDPVHLTNRQQCYCYCGGPGEWNLKMLQCCRCAQWFHEACTQCLSKPLLYGDRFYVFECCVCTGGPESVRRLPLRWVDNWDNLLLGELADTPKGDRYSQLLSALSSHKDRFISGKEIKKRKGLFGLHTRAAGQGSSGAGRRRLARRRVPSEPAETMELRSSRERWRLDKALTQEVVETPASTSQAYGSYGGSSSSYNFRRTDARCLESAPIRMFASFHPSANTARSLRSTAVGPDTREVSAPERDSPEHPPACALLPHVDRPAPSSKRLPEHPAATPTSSGTLCPATTTPTTSSTYFGAMGRLARGEAVRVLARRVTLDGTVQYLVEWGNGGMF